MSNNIIENQKANDEWLGRWAKMGTELLATNLKYLSVLTQVNVCLTHRTLSCDQCWLLEP